jgi:IS5 family transposase
LSHNSSFCRWSYSAPSQSGTKHHRSDEQEARLKEKGCTSHIHERAYRNKPLTAKQNAANKKRSHVRVRIEHVFGHIETAMNGCYVRTIGMARAKAKIGLETMAYNISRFTFLMRANAAAG